MKMEINEDKAIQDACGDWRTRMMCLIASVKASCAAYLADARDPRGDAVNGPTLATYLVECEELYARLTRDQDEVERLRRMLSARMSETRMALTEDDRVEYEALARRTTR